MPTPKERAAIKDAILGFRKSNQYLESVIAASHDGILVVDGAGRLEFANPSSHVFLGRPEGQLIGNPLTTVIPPESHASFVR